MSRRWSASVSRLPGLKVSEPLQQLLSQEPRCAQDPRRAPWAASTADLQPGCGEASQKLGLQNLRPLQVYPEGAGRASDGLGSLVCWPGELVNTFSRTPL